MHYVTLILHPLSIATFSSPLPSSLPPYKEMSSSLIVNAPWYKSIFNLKNWIEFTLTKKLNTYYDEEQQKSTEKHLSKSCGKMIISKVYR